MKNILPSFVLVFFCIIAHGQQVNFKQHHYFHTISYPDKIEIRDINNDGIDDVISVGEYAINVLFAKVEGEDQIAGYDDDFWYGKIANGDFDGDHDIDIAFVNADSLCILQNTGSGKLKQLDKAYFICTNNEVSAITAADMNNDNIEDLVAINPFTQTLLIYHGSASGFLTPIQRPGTTSYYLDHNDLNNDNFEDLLLINGDQKQVTVMINNGDETFQIANAFSLTSYPLSISVSDFDGDNDKDMAVVYSETSFNNGIAIYKNSGGTFTLHKSYPTDLEYLSPQFLTTGDFDNDLDIDLAYIEWSGGKMNVMLNDGSATFGAPSSYEIYGQPHSINATDFDDDGKTDIIIGNHSGIQVAFNKGGNAFDMRLYGAPYPSSLTQGDFNADGSPDVAVANYNRNTSSIMLNDRHGKFVQRLEIKTGTAPTAIKSADLNNDGIADLIVVNTDVDSASFIQGLGGGTFSTPQSFLTGGGPINLTIGDFNDDGKKDIATTNTTSSTLSLIMNSESGFQTAINITGVYFGDRISCGDINGDKLDDIFIISEGNRSSLYMLINKGTNSFETPVMLSYYDDVQAVAIKDFTFDGIVDVGYTEDGHFIVLQNDGAGKFSYKSYENGLYQARQITVGDYNGDGKQDVAFGALSSRAFGILLADNNGGYIDDLITLPYKGDLIDMTTANFDGDEKDDLSIVGWPYHYLSILISLPRMTITVHDTTRYYGHANPAFKSTVEGWPGADDEFSITYRCDASELTGVGTREIVPIVSDSISENFAVVKMPGILAIEPAPLTITALDVTRKFGQSSFLPIKMEGLLNDDHIIVDAYTEANINSPEGIYPIVPLITGGNPPNYNTTITNGTLTITPLDGTTFHPQPNPSWGYFTVNNWMPEDIHYIISNIAGVIVNEGTMKPGINALTLDVSVGLYIMRTDNGKIAKLIIY